MIIKRSRRWAPSHAKARLISGFWLRASAREQNWHTNSCRHLSLSRHRGYERRQGNSCSQRGLVASTVKLLPSLAKRLAAGHEQRTFSSTEFHKSLCPCRPLYWRPLAGKQLWRFSTTFIFALTCTSLSRHSYPVFCSRRENMSLILESLGFKWRAARGLRFCQRSNKSGPNHTQNISSFLG